MVQSPSWAANWFAASQEIPCISRNTMVHYCTQKRPPPVSILGQPNPVHIPTSHLLEIRPNIIHPSTPGSPQWSLSLRFPHQDRIHPPLLNHRTPHTLILNSISLVLTKPYIVNGMLVLNSVLFAINSLFLCLSLSVSLSLSLSGFWFLGVSYDFFFPLTSNGL